jgi:hypothetical protein
MYFITLVNDLLHQKEAALDNNELSLAPAPSVLHDTVGQARTNSTYVAQRLAGEPRQGHPTNIPMDPLAGPSPSVSGGGPELSGGSK